MVRYVFWELFWRAGVDDDCVVNRKAFADDNLPRGTCNYLLVSRRFGIRNHDKPVPPSTSIRIVRDSTSPFMKVSLRRGLKWDAMRSGNAQVR